MLFRHQHRSLPARARTRTSARQLKMHISLSSLAVIALSIASQSETALGRPQPAKRCDKPSIRKEWRSLTRAEQADFVRATAVCSLVYSFELAI